MDYVTIDKTLLGILIVIMLWLFIGLGLEIFGKSKAEREARKLFKSIKDRNGKL